mgnify:CR=1 FL=1
MPALNISDFEAIARSRMEPTAFDYYAGGSGDERTLADNIAAFLSGRPVNVVNAASLRPRAWEGMNA